VTGEERLPVELVGVWRRDGLVVEGVRQAEACDVLWIQSAAGWCADIRLRRLGVQPPTQGPAKHFARLTAFAGRASWRAPELTWTPVLALTPPAGPDIGRMEWAADLLVEHGTALVNGVPVAFHEEWARVADAQDAAVSVSGEAIRLAAGGSAVSVTDRRPFGSFRATRESLVDGEWRVDGLLVRGGAPFAT
jgi:hypothetical protein